MRHSEKCSLRGKRSQQVQRENRLAAALDYRPMTSLLIFELWTRNPRTGTKHHLEIKHEPSNGNDRYTVYLDSVKWQKPFSRWGFCRWLFTKIDSVIRN